VALVLGAAAGTPNTPGKTVTLSFRTETGLSTGMRVNIQWPANYLTPSPLNVPTNTFGVDYSSLTTFAATTTETIVLPPGPILPTSIIGFSITVGSAGAPAGSYTITLTGVTIGAATVSNIGCVLRPDTQGNTCLVVSTTSDDQSFSSFPSILPKGQVQGVSVSVLEADRVPGQPNKPLTISFTTQTDLAAGNTVTM
jgi:hypothetical protein